jgi:hypothetical protein
MPMKPGKVVVKDRGYIKRLQNQRALKGWKASVGVHGTDSDRDEDGPDNVQLAVWHEFGAEGIPERSFLRSAFDQNVSKYEKLMGMQTGLVIDGVQTPKGAVSVVAERMVADVVNGINRGIPPPNAPSTIEAKGSSKPLIDSGQLKGSITFKVHK